MLWSTVRERASAKGFSFSMGDTKYPRVCRRMKLPVLGDNTSPPPPTPPPVFHFHVSSECHCSSCLPSPSCSTLFCLFFSFFFFNVPEIWMLYVLQTCVTFFVGMKVGRTISNDFSYIGAPFLMGTVALGRCGSLILQYKCYTV